MAPQGASDHSQPPLGPRKGRWAEFHRVPKVGVAAVTPRTVDCVETRRRERWSEKMVGNSGRREEPEDDDGGGDVTEAPVGAECQPQRPA